MARLSHAYQGTCDQISTSSCNSVTFGTCHPDDPHGSHRRPLQRVHRMGDPPPPRSWRLDRHRGPHSSAAATTQRYMCRGQGERRDGHCVMPEFDRCLTREEGPDLPSGAVDAADQPFRCERASAHSSYRTARSPHRVPDGGHTHMRVHRTRASEATRWTHSSSPTPTSAARAGYRFDVTTPLPSSPARGIRDPRCSGGPWSAVATV